MVGTIQNPNFKTFQFGMAFGFWAPTVIELQPWWILPLWYQKVQKVSRQKWIQVLTSAVNSRRTYHTPFEEFDINLNQDAPTSVYEVPTYTDKKSDVVDASELEIKIIRQLEYYFGDFNLPKDRFMQNINEQENGNDSTTIRIQLLCILTVFVFSRP